jgi:hypothetical protein
MASRPNSRFRIALDTHLLNDLARGNLAASIQKVAPQSTLIQTPEIAASVAALGKKAAALKGDNEAVATDEKQLKKDIAARDASRTAVDLELSALKTLVVRDAKTEADVTSMGFSLLPTAQTRAKPDAPLVESKMIKRTRVMHAFVVGKIPGRFVAEASTDPNPTTWVTLVGTGRSRSLLGYASGTKVWVRFAQVRYGLQSDWSTTILVTIP